jgi:HEPN domain-containing protein
MGDPAIVREWFSKADEDFRFAEVNLMEGRNFFPQICFHFQQAAEKYLKSFIIAHELQFRKVHDLEQLLDACLQIEKRFEDIREDCSFLDGFYVDTRYPVHWPAHYTRNEAEKAHDAAMRIRVLVMKLLLI